MGGNVFKNSQGQTATQRINQTDVAPTVDWLEQLTGLNLRGDIDPRTKYPQKWLGSTGKKESSGDLDLAVDPREAPAEKLISHLKSWAESHGFKADEYVKKGSNQVHFKTPINGNPNNGYVQTDFMSMEDLPLTSFFLTAPVNSEYSGKDRLVMMNSIAKPLGLKIVERRGLVNRATDEVVSTDFDKIAKTILNKNATVDDLYSVETLVQALQGDPKREEKLKDARDFFSKNGIAFFENRGESDTNFLARLRDRIVNQGMQVIVEEVQLNEAVSARIEHLEDLVFERGSRGIEEALAILQHAEEDTARTTTVKWDGKPAIIFGRKPDGQFVLTDKAGFMAKGYDGLATSPEMMARIQSTRPGERGELIALYAKLFPMLKAATPTNMKGYVKGDLLFTSHPPEVAGAFVFKPNTIEYKIPASSPLGERIANSDVAVAMHTKIDSPAGQEEPIGNMKFNPVPGLLLIEPSVKDIKNIETEKKLVKQIKQINNKHGRDINQVFNPADLRAMKITDLPALCKRYINSRINTNFDNLLPGFGEWLQSNVTPSKFQNIVEYLQSPRANMDGISAAFTSFLLLHELKMDVLQQLDRQQPGQEGWVVASDAGRAKLVNRFDFSARNKAQNSPK